jgi:hypothetical protein
MWRDSLPKILDRFEAPHSAGPPYIRCRAFSLQCVIIVTYQCRRITLRPNGNPLYRDWAKTAHFGALGEQPDWFEDVAGTTRVHWAVAGGRRMMLKSGDHDTNGMRHTRTIALRGETSIMTPSPSIPPKPRMPRVMLYTRLLRRLGTRHNSRSISLR